MGAPANEDAFKRLHLTRVRLIERGWHLEEFKLTGSGGDWFIVRIRDAIGECREEFARHFYSDALDAALKFASHVQARIDAGAKR